MKKKLKTPLLLTAVISLSLITVGQIVYASTAEPGSEKDPIVTLSYLDLKIEQLKDYIDQNNTSSSEPESNNTGQSLIFEVVELEKGQTLIADGGTEIILRAGKATAIISPMGGLSDVTGATDLQEGEEVPTNHLLIIPRDDGRGIRALENCFVMVKGGYKIN